MFAIFVALSVIILLTKDSRILYVFKYLFSPVSVFLHEASHGITAFCLGMEVVDLHMRWLNGYVTSRYILGVEEFQSTIVTFSGYAGTTVFGLLIFLASINYKRILLSLLISCCFIFTLVSTDLTTVGVMLYVTFIFALCLFDAKPINHILRFLGAYLMVSSIESPMFQIENTKHSDSVTLVNYYGFNEHFFIGLWVTFSVIIIALSFVTLRKLDSKKGKAEIK
nr:M50 family metallopeptidase [Vibrio splendidus]MCC4883060.1 M50 family metallopeptidase [Vibrio splendidus]